MATKPLNLSQFWWKSFCFLPAPCEDNSAEGGVNLFTNNLIYWIRVSLQQRPYRFLGDQLWTEHKVSVILSENWPDLLPVFGATMFSGFYQKNPPIRENRTIHSRNHSTSPPELTIWGKYLALTRIATELFFVSNVQHHNRPERPVGKNSKVVVLGCWVLGRLLCRASRVLFLPSALPKQRLGHNVLDTHSSFPGPAV